MVQQIIVSTYDQNVKLKSLFSAISSLTFQGNFSVEETNAI